MIKTSQIPMFVLGGLIVIGFFVLLGLLIFIDVPQANSDLLNLVVGSLIASFTTIVGYFFGSSKSSADKTEILNKTNGKE